MKTKYLTGKYVRGGYFKATYLIKTVLQDAGAGEDYICYEIRNGCPVGQRVIFGVSQLHFWVRKGYMTIQEVSA